MTVEIKRSFLGGRDASQAVLEAKRATLDDLAEHDLYAAAIALSAPRNALTNFNDYMLMRGAMLAGGLHRVRLTGGRSIDG